MDAAGERMLQQFFSTFRCRIVDKGVERVFPVFRISEAAAKEMTNKEKGQKIFLNCLEQFALEKSLLIMKDALSNYDESCCIKWKA